MSAPRLLVVEDEEHLAEVISDNLAHEGWEVDVVGNGREALERIRADAPALVLLDVMLPGLDGFTICERLRAERNDVPILFLTAKSDDDDRVRGLQLGGDDFLGKPFDLRELILRVRAILRRTQWFKSALERGGGASDASAADEVDADGTIDLGDVRVDLKAYTATRDGREQRLSSKEAMILRYLVERRGEVVSRAEILDRVWGYDAFPTNRTIDNFIVRLRRAIEPDPRNPRYIHTIRSVGYRLTP